MPRTCTSPKTNQKIMGRDSKKQRRETCELDLKQLIPRVMLPYNEATVRRICAESLVRICEEYSIDANIPTFQKLAEFAADPEQSNNSIVGLFFLCLDIDIRLKESMLNAESDAMKRKLTCFFTNLRSRVIPVFFCEEEMDADELVAQCHETFLLA